jgi:WD40 repeat protein
VAFHPDGKQVAFISYSDRAPALWDIQTGLKTCMLGPPGAYGTACVALSPDGRLLAANPGDFAVTVWDTQTRQRLFELPAQRNAIWCQAWDPGGQRLAVGLADGGLVVWNLPPVRAHLARLGLDWE